MQWLYRLPISKISLKRALDKHIKYIDHHGKYEELSLTIAIPISQHLLTKLINFPEHCVKVWLQHFLEFVFGLQTYCEFRGKPFWYFFRCLAFVNDNLLWNSFPQVYVHWEYWLFWVFWKSMPLEFFTKVADICACFF